MTHTEALKLALEALEAMQSHAAAERKGLLICDESIIALRAALEQPEQEPVACIRTWHKENGDQHAELWDWCDGIGSLPEGEHLLYTHPPRREWRGLTEEEIDAVWDDAQVFNTHYDIASAIEAALKERNA